MTGWGTGGTLTGAGEMIKKARPDTRIIVTEPAGASLLAGAEFKPHKIQGWTPDFIPAVLNRSVADEILPVTDEEAIQTSRALAAKEGIFCGISSGGTFAAALKVAQKAPKGSVILAMLPDTGERYLTTALFEGISDASDAEPQSSSYNANSFTLNDSLQPGGPPAGYCTGQLRPNPSGRLCRRVHGESTWETSRAGAALMPRPPTSWQRGSEILFLSITSGSAGRRWKAD